MFEAVIALCLAGPAGPCRDVLLPGYEAPSEAACRADLSRHPPDMTGFVGLIPRGAARCTPVGEALEVQEIAPGVFVHAGLVEEPDKTNRGDVSNLGFVIGERSVAVIDSGSAAWVGESLWRTIRALTDLPVSHVILTHMHPDHVFGASMFERAGAKVVGHATLARALADRQDNYLESLARLIGEAALIGTHAAEVSLPVAQETRLDLGGRSLNLRAWPPAHTGSDLTVLDERTGTLFAGDLVFDAHTPALDGSLIGWLAVLAEMQGMEITRLVPGHGAALLPWPKGGDAQARYLETLARDTRAAIAAGERLGDAVQHIAETERAHWALFEAYNARNATVAFTELEWE